ncbi:MAG: tRNA 5-methoxyuridine(34)/uridine 5-oxyacetic acid(34) synthase CmoB [Oligoflexales bacterium]|nr:tRNA 5-methoxyuridine(34)/uridine 5-oxyacetic acid(34) synthase CmoB [Oligoflexales bacterium]
MSKPNLQALRKALFSKLTQQNLDIYAKALANLPPLRADHIIFNREQVCFAAKNHLVSSGELERLRAVLLSFCPWKKGPFNIFGIEIDAEWRSDLKWQRLLPYVGSLEGQVVADIGCNNAYYMYRMLDLQPKLVMGFEPYAKHWFTFQLFQKLAPQKQLTLELFGAEHLDHFEQCFDSIFCLGILYHHTDPIGLLRKIYQSLKPGGQLFIDCQGIPGEGSYALFPQNRYAQARAIWFLPTQECLLNWLRRSQFRNIELIYSGELSTEEQRRTTWADVDSLEEFLDPKNPQLTVEGYPRPHRFYLKALR